MTPDETLRSLRGIDVHADVAHWARNLIHLSKLPEDLPVAVSREGNRLRLEFENNIVVEVRKEGV